MFKVRWADLERDTCYGADKMRLKQASKMAKLSATLKRAGFVLDGTDPEGFAVYLRPDKPASKTRH